ncbi:fluoride efflux transporter CrcB [Magnetofaba australis]|uniref:Fluoride-specific ion channel FluC n=1 Tax=Magnetofaba australis IT-1 TaxID=1434232 RepID=A0A1Y2K7D3_9PROT|nr:fluoride efflux transporter CrcB [Magnetofaba australis]OSM04371.1 putative camphor resistance protein CrcB [Magnetofaba australis IT-1]
MSQLVWVAVGGAVGAVARYGVSNGVYGWLGRGFPWGTLAVNFFGSFLMGLLFVLMVERTALPLELRSTILVGGLGAFTTFSTFSIETLQLIEKGAWSLAALNMFASVSVCIAAVWAGVWMARMI